MQDQADELRLLARQSSMAGSCAPCTPIVAVAGGKGGVGTTTTAVNLSLALAKSGRRVILVDADLNRADATKLCGIDDLTNIADVLESRCTLHEALRPGPCGIQVLPGVWGSSHVVHCSPSNQKRLTHRLKSLDDQADVAIVDVGSGLNHSVRRFWQAASHVLLVTTAETTSIMDAYAAIKMLFPSEGAQPVHLLANMASYDSALDVHARIGRACGRFLGIEPLLAGHVDVDAELAQATAACRAYMLEHPTGVAAQSLQRLANYFARLLWGNVADESAARAALQYAAA